MTTEAEPVRITLLYLGVREMSKEPLNHLWYDLTGKENDGSPLVMEDSRQQFYGSKKKGHGTKNITIANPGTICSFEKTQAGVYGSTARYIGRWACDEDVVRWTAENNAIDRAAELKLRATKEAKRHLDWEALEPFRLAYQGSLNYRQQQMLIAQVLQFITSYKKEDHKH